MGKNCLFSVLKLVPNLRSDFVDKKFTIAGLQIHIEDTEYYQQNLEKIIIDLILKILKLMLWFSLLKYTEISQKCNCGKDPI